MSDWQYFRSDDFLSREYSKDYSDKPCTAMMKMSWLVHPDDNRGYGDGAYAMYFGKSFQHGGGARAGERPIPPGLRKLADKVAAKVNCPVNYIQCHRYAPHIPVTPHRDPGGMIAPMLVLGQERTFRVGGYIENENETPQGQCEVKWHHPQEEILLEHGSLLVFNGGRTAHSMFPANQDANFNQGGFDWRISIIFRWTTEAMRKYGPGKKATEAGQKAQYMADVNDFVRKRLEENK